MSNSILHPSIFDPPQSLIELQRMIASTVGKLGHPAPDEWEKIISLYEQTAEALLATDSMPWHHDTLESSYLRLVKDDPDGEHPTRVRAAFVRFLIAVEDKGKAAAPQSLAKRLWKASRWLTGQRDRQMVYEIIGKASRPVSIQEILDCSGYLIPSETKEDINRLEQGGLIVRVVAGTCPQDPTLGSTYRMVP